MPDEATTARPATTGAMHIGEVAARTELSVRSLRHWEEVGLLTPSDRTDGGFRLYTEDDVEKILVIRRMKPLGFTLDEMKEAMTHLQVLRDRQTVESDRERASAHLTGVRAGARERRENLVRQLEMADEFIGILDREIA